MKAHRFMQLVPVVALYLLGGCVVGEAPASKRASATLESRSGSTVTGLASFAEVGHQVVLTLNVSGATPGTHAAHLHVVPDCSATDATSAMGHWNPDMQNHGLPSAAPHHMGDCGNFLVGADGTGTLLLNADWSIGTGEANDVVGHSIIVHAAPDDGATQTPPGNAGARVACGIVSM